ncbi:MAG: hypothetical protein JOZ60_08635 [Verrucomicrobia bacterium]|nr:hypothetical protein [Verrucomicrobiota bacterium]
MKRGLFVLLMAGAVVPGFVLAQDTAYKALRTLGAQRGEKALNRVTAIVGHSGRPQPVAWRIVLDDPGARGGERELDIVSGQISSERTPVRSPAAELTPIDLTKLNLDSDGAFRAAEKEASRNQVGFDSVNYRLSLDGATGQPVWNLDMFDYEQRLVGAVRIAATDGTLLSTGNWVPQTLDDHRQQNQQQSDAEALAGPPPPVNGDANPPADYRSPEYQDRGDLSQGGSDEHPRETIRDRANRYGASVAHFGKTVVHRTTRIFQTVGGWFQEKFTGRNTIDPKHGQDDDSDQQEPSEDQYSRSTQPHDPYSQPVTPPPQ